MSSNDQDRPNGEERELGREKHRAQLEAVRAAFAAGEGVGAPDPEPRAPAPDYEAEYLATRLVGTVRELERRQKRTARLAGASALALAGAAGAVLFVGPPGAGSLEEITARSIRADRVAVTGDLRLLDASGNELAVLGRETHPGGASADAPVVLSLSADGDPSRQTLRLAASKTGAAVSLDSPTGESSLSLMSLPSGPSVELRSGERRRRLSSDGARTVGGDATASAGADAAAELPAWTPRKDEFPNGGVPELRDIGHGFLVADLSTVAAPEGGVSVRGRVVNTTSVTHGGLVFRVNLGDLSEIVTIYRISPGNSTGFSVVFAGASPESVGDLHVEYLGSTVAYQATQTDPLYGRNAVPR